MEQLLNDKRAVGVLVARMQVPYLTESHKKMINTVIQRHGRVILFLGVTNKPIDKKNPFSFRFRSQMINQTFHENGGMTVHPLPDNEDNSLWVKTLDSLIQAHLNVGENALLYGGRDSFIPYYKKDNGKFDSIELEQQDYDSGTELRLINSVEEPAWSTPVARAILWTLNQIS
jgi:hypothetical protein